jgi:hypothetical protein
MPIYAIALLAGGTKLFRLIGPIFRRSWPMPEKLSIQLFDGSVVLLLALAVTSALTEGHGFAGCARAVGVSLGAELALARAPFPIAVIAAAAITAGLRWFGFQ